MDRIDTERMIGKSFRITKKLTVSKREGESGQQIRVVKKIVGVLLLLLAAIFGGAVARMPALAAFTVVFAYICVQLWIWIEMPKKEN